MKRYRFALTFLISLILHSALLVFLIKEAQRGFKKGVGENPKIKISSFAFGEFDSQAHKITHPLPQQTKRSSKQPQSPKSQTQSKAQPKQDIKTKSLQPSALSQSTPTTQDSTTPPQEQDAIQDLQDLQGDSTFNQPQPTLPLEQTLSYQLADMQTKKNISEFYGAEFGQLGSEEQEFILNNLSYIGRITQQYLRYPPNAGMLAQSGGNAVEFYLHPNGDISELKLIKKSGFILLDRNSAKTIEIAYKDYPHPKTKTLIRFYINYYLVRP